MTRVGELIQEIGAYAGIAAVFGLAFLALLYFSQARELRRLRDWAGDAPEEAAERTAGEPHPRTDQAPRPVPAPRPGAPATAAAQSGAARQQPGPPAPAARPGSKPAPAPAGTNGPGRPAPVPVGARAESGAGVPAATAAAAGALAPGREERASGTLRSSVPPGRPTHGRPSTAPAGRTSVAATPLRTTSRPGATLPGDDYEDDGRFGEGRRRTTAMIVAGALLLIGAGALAIVLVSGGEDEPSNTASSPAVNSNPRTPSGGPLTPTTTTVAVLNGTTVSGLARQVADDVQAEGFKVGTVTNAADQQRQATVVAFAPNARDMADVVARTLRVTDVQPLDDTTRAVAGRGAQVVVTVGGDRTP